MTCLQFSRMILMLLWASLSAKATVCRAAVRFNCPILVAKRSSVMASSYPEGVNTLIHFFRDRQSLKAEVQRNASINLPSTST